MMPETILTFEVTILKAECLFCAAILSILCASIACPCEICSTCFTPTKHELRWSYWLWSSVLFSPRAHR